MRVCGPRSQSNDARSGSENAGAVTRIDCTVCEKSVEGGGELIKAVTATDGESGEHGIGGKVNDCAVDIVVDEFPTGEKGFVGDAIDGKMDTEFGGGGLERSCG